MNGTPRVDRARQCDGKVPHEDRRTARRARQKLGHRDADGHLTIYRCPWCDRFHIGHAFADPYLADKAARAAQQANAVAAGAELELEAGRALAALWRIPLEKALGYLTPPPPGDVVLIDEVHHLTDEQVAALTPFAIPAGLVYFTNAEEVADG